MNWNKAKYKLVKQIIDKETRGGPISFNELSKVSAKYSPGGRRISRDTLKFYSNHWGEDIFTLKKKRGRMGHQIISKKNYNDLQEISKKREEALLRINDYYDTVVNLFREGKGIISHAKKMVVLGQDGNVSRKYDLKFPMIFPSKSVSLEDFYGEFTDGKNEIEKREKGKKKLEVLRRIRTKPNRNRE